MYQWAVPEAFEVWDLPEERVFKVHPYARVKLRSEFRKDTFQTFFLNARRYQIPFLGCRALNSSVEFIDVVRITHHVGSRVNYTPNICIYSWVFNPTDTITDNVSTITQCAYDPICSFRRFVLRSNHELLRLKRIELKHIRFEDYQRV